MSNINRFILFLAAFFVIIIFCGSATAATIQVNNSTPNAIGNAINTAESGDTIYLSDGNYYEHNLVIGKNLTISGPTTTNAPSTVIDAENQGMIFTINPGANVTIQNLVLTNGTATWGGAIYSEGNLTVKNCTFENNTAGVGGAIYNDQGATLNVNNCTFTNNTAPESWGGAIYNACDGILNVSDSNFINNAAEDGSAIFNRADFSDDSNGNTICSAYGTMNISNCTFKNNTSIGGSIENWGIGIITNSLFSYNTCGIRSEGILTITQCVFDNNKDRGAIQSSGWINICILTVNDSQFNSNTATNGGAIYNGTVLNVNNCTFTNNTATDNGGAISNDGSYAIATASIKNSTFTNNKANTGYGGAIHNYESTQTVTGCTFTKNTAFLRGGAICIDISNATIENSTFTYNKAGDSGGAVYNYDNVEKLTIMNSIFTNNTAADFDGGAILNMGTCTITDSNINNNTAKYNGGGIENDGACTVSESTIDGNIAYWGGGIENAGTISIVNSAVKNNSAVDNGNGGGIYNNCSTCTVTGSSITGNTATNGGGIYNDGTFNNGALSVSRCNFISNKATKNGNAIYNYKSPSSNCIIRLNRFYDTASGYEIYSNKGNADARYNWWGFNSSPASKVYGTVKTSPWLILKLDANPSLVGKILSSTITADITHDSAGGAHTLSNGPGISITFTTTLGSITSPIYTKNGIAKTTLTTGSTTGTPTVSALLDNQITTIDYVPPKVSSTYPTNKKTGFSRTGTITIKFSENIYSSTYYSKIYVKNLTTGKTTTITKTISKNYLYMKNSSKRSAYTWYQVTIPAAAIKDKAGNKLAKAYTFKFKTGG